MRLRVRQEGSSQPQPYSLHKVMTNKVCGSQLRVDTPRLKINEHIPLHLKKTARFLRLHSRNLFKTKLIYRGQFAQLRVTLKVQRARIKIKQCWYGSSIMYLCTGEVLRSLQNAVLQLSRIVLRFKY